MLLKSLLESGPSQIHARSFQGLQHEGIVVRGAFHCAFGKLRVGIGRSRSRTWHSGSVHRAFRTAHYAKEKFYNPALELSANLTTGSAELRATHGSPGDLRRRRLQRASIGDPAARRDADVDDERLVAGRPELHAMPARRDQEAGRGVEVLHGPHVLAVHEDLRERRLHLQPHAAAADLWRRRLVLRHVDSASHRDEVAIARGLAPERAIVAEAVIGGPKSVAEMPDTEPDAEAGEVRTKKVWRVEGRREHEHVAWARRSRNRRADDGMAVRRT